MLVALHFFQSGAANEVVVELDERTVTDFIRSNVVVFDLVGGKAATDCASCFVGSSRQPLAIGFHFFAGVNSRQRGRDPAGFQGVGRVCA